MASAPRGAPGLLSKSLGEPARSGASSAATAGTSSAPVQANKQNQAADDGSPWHAAQPPVAPAGVSTSAFYGSSPVHGRGISHLVRPAAWDPGHGLRSYTDTEVRCRQAVCTCSSRCSSSHCSSSHCSSSYCSSCDTHWRLSNTGTLIV